MKNIYKLNKNNVKCFFSICLLCRNNNMIIGSLKSIGYKIFFNTRKSVYSYQSALRNLDYKNMEASLRLVKNNIELFKNNFGTNPDVFENTMNLQIQFINSLKHLYVESKKIEGSSLLLDKNKENIISVKNEMNFMIENLFNNKKILIEFLNKNVGKDNYYFCIDNNLHLEDSELVRTIFGHVLICDHLTNKGFALTKTNYVTINYNMIKNHLLKKDLDYFNNISASNLFSKQNQTVAYIENNKIVCKTQEFGVGKSKSNFMEINFKNNLEFNTVTKMQNETDFESIPNICETTTKCVSALTDIVHSVQNNNINKELTDRTILDMIYNKNKIVKKYGYEEVDNILSKISDNINGL